MKKQYIVPSLTVVQFKVTNVIATSTLPMGGNSSDPGAPLSTEAPYRNPIWDED